MGARVRRCQRCPFPRGPRWRRSARAAPARLSAVLVGLAPPTRRPSRRGISSSSRRPARFRRLRQAAARLRHLHGDRRCRCGDPQPRRRTRRRRRRRARRLDRLGHAQPATRVHPRHRRGVDGSSGDHATGGPPRPRPTLGPELRRSPAVALPPRAFPDPRRHPGPPLPHLLGRPGRHLPVGGGDQQVCRGAGAPIRRPLRRRVLPLVRTQPGAPRRPAVPTPGE